MIGLGLIALLAAAPVAGAVPGDLDPSFGSGGKQRTDFTGADDQANALAVQPDGKIVAAGESDPHDAGVSAFALARYNPDGSLDSTFSDDGRQTTSLGDGARISDIASQVDGRIVAVGEAAGAFALARYNPDGSLDTSFSEDGKQTTGFGLTSFGIGHAVAIQPDGKIIVAGYSSQQTPESDHSDFTLVRYHPDGSLDTSFSSDGIQTTDFANRGDKANAIKVLPGGSIVAGGTAGDGNATFALARYTPGGELDSAFSEDGKTANGFGGFFAVGEAMAVQADGGVVVAGYFDGFGSMQIDFALARYNPDGWLDSSFGVGGLQTTDLAGEDDGSYALAVQPDGKLIAAGWSKQFSSDDFALARYEGGGPAVVDPPDNPTPPTNPIPLPQAPKSPKPRPAEAQLTNVRLSKKTITNRQRATISFRLSAPAKVSVKILKNKAGVRKGKRCVKPGKTSDGKRCDLQVVSLSRSLGAGAHAIRLPKLTVGRYLMVARAGSGQATRHLVVLPIAQANS